MHLIIILWTCKLRKDGTCKIYARIEGKKKYFKTQLAVLPKDFDYWKKGINELALRPNVNCKISGILIRVGKDWTLKEIDPYVHYAIERFGFDRLVYGGDWPVVLRADFYLAWSRVFEKLTRPYAKVELHKLYHLNADRIYQLGD